MRRLHQVAIVAVALLSLIAFLVYKHEYERLRNILEVLNTFGNPPGSEGGTGRSPITGDGGMARFRTSGGRAWPDAGYVTWRQLDDEVHVVSTAFWNRGHSIVVHGVIRGRRRRVDAPWTRCHVRLDAASAPSFKTTVSALVLDGQSSTDVWLSFKLVCNYSALTPPVAVSFSELGSPSAATFNVFPTKDMTLPDHDHDVVICATAMADSTSAAESTDDDESLVVQFLEYHRHVGVTRILIYTDNVLPAVRRRIQMMASSLVVDGIVVGLIDWNAPISTDDSMDSATSTVMRRDCISRFQSSSSLTAVYVAFLELHQLLVSRYHSRLSNFVKDESDIVDNKLGGLRLDRRIFCREFNDGPNALPETESFVFRFKNDLASTPPMFTKTRWIGEELVARSVSVSRNGTYLLKIESSSSSKTLFAPDGLPVLDAGRSFPKVSDEFACVHAYVRCGAGYKRLIGHASTDDVVIKRIHDQFL